MCQDGSRDRPVKYTQAVVYGQKSDPNELEWTARGITEGIEALEQVLLF